MGLALGCVWPVEADLEEEEEEEEDGSDPQGPKAGGRVRQHDLVANGG